MSVESVTTTLTARWRRAGYPEFAWWIPLAMDGFAVVAAVLAVSQRNAQGATLPAAAFMLVAVSPWFAALAGYRVPWWLLLVVTLASSTLVIVRYPVEYDFTLLVWVMLVGHIGSCESLLRGLAATAAAVTSLAVLSVGGWIVSPAFWVVAVVVGGHIGLIMRSQQVRLDEQARAHRDHEAAAILEERQRIAREVHDVVAHSLSVTMLHLTGARRSLEEDRADGVDDAVEALREAERIGREAMNDIRTTVGLLGHESAHPTATPDVHDLPGLVDEFRRAGLDVVLDVRGDPTAVPANAGLTLYRIARESLANVAKHEPGSTSHVRLDCLGDGQRLVIRNDLRPSRRPQPGGSGLKGMRERAELLGGSFSAGPRGDCWEVQVFLPLRASGDVASGRPGSPCHDDRVADQA